MTKQSKQVEQAERAVLVTTIHRGVFFGYATNTDGDAIKLRAGRNCVSWPSENRGFLGLANMGPVRGARVGPPADIEVRNITSVSEVTPAAVAAWEAAPWK
jgi:hypothetical protein